MQNSKQLSFADVKKTLLKHKWWLVAVVSALLLVLVLAVLPLVISQQFQKWTLANGGEKVTIENVDFNPFTAKLGLYNIVIERSGYQPFLLPELQLHAQWRDLFSRRFIIESLTVKGVHLTVDHSLADESHAGGILLNKLIGGEQQDSKADDKPWTFRLNDLQLENFQLVYRQPGIETKLQVETLSLAGLDSFPESNPAIIRLKGTIDSAPLFINGNLALFSDAPAFDGKVVLNDFDFSPYLQMISPEMKQNHVAISVNSQVNLGQEKSKDFFIEYDGLISLQDVDWKDPGADIKARQLSWKGIFNAGLPVSADMNIKTDGRLQADQLALQSVKMDLALNNGQFVWQGKADASYAKNQDLKLALNGQLLNTQLDLEMASQDTVLKNGNFNWQGKADISLASAGNWTVQSEGKLQNELFDLERAREQFKLDTQLLAWQGNLNLAGEQEQLSVQSLSDLKLSELRMQKLDDQQRLILSREINLEKIDVQSLQDIRANRLSLTGFSLGAPHQLQELELNLTGFINYDDLTLEQLRYSAEEGISINSVVQEGVKHAIRRQASGEWNFGTFVGAVKRLAGKAGEQDAETSPKTGDSSVQDVSAAEGKALPVKIGSITIRPGGELYYIDYTLPKPFVQKIVIDSFNISNIDSQQPDKGGDLSFQASINNSVVNIDGNVFAFAKQQPSFDLKGEVQALSLIPYSIFIERVVGYEVDSGSLNATTKLLAKDGRLESNTELTLNQLDIKALSEERLKAIDGKLNTGLETGLSMLKDKHDTIKLDMPINGSFDNLQVDPSDIINQALGSALKKGAKTYFAAALFPFGTLLVIADAAADQAMQVKLDPVLFEAGSAGMDTKYHAYLEKIAKVLDEKPKIHVKVCGVATAGDSQQFEAKMRQEFEQKLKAESAGDAQKPAEQQAKAAPKEQPVFVVDRAEIERQARELALGRAAAVTNFLLKSQDVEPKRLIECQPRVEMDVADSKPRADLLL